MAHYPLHDEEPEDGPDRLDAYEGAAANPNPPARTNWGGNPTARIWEHDTRRARQDERNLRDAIRRALREAKRTADQTAAENGGAR